MFDNDDDINSSGLGPTNESSSLVRGLQEIAEHDVKHRSAAERELRRKAKFYKNLSNIPEDLVKKLGYGSHKKTKALLSSTKSKLMNSIESMLERENIRASKISEKAFSETAMNSMIRSDELSSSITQGTSYFEESTWGSMTSRQDELLKRLSSVRNEARNVSKSIFSQSTITRPENLGREDVYENLRQLEGEKRSIAIEYGAIERQKSIRKQMGTDPSSREQAMYGYLNEAREKGFAEEILKQQAVSINEGAGKKSVSFSELSNELDQQLKLLTEDFKRLSEATADQREAIQQEVDKRVENIQTLEKAENIAGGAGGQNKWDRYVGAANMASSAFYGAAGLVQSLGVAQPMQRMANVSTAAGMANNYYDLYRRARSGDVSAQMQLSGLNESGAFAEKIKSNTQWVQGLTLGGTALQATAGAFQVKAGLTKGVPSLGTFGTDETLSGVNNIAGAAVTGVITAKDMYDQTTATTQGLTARQAAEIAKASITQVQGIQAQGLRNFYVGAGETALGMNTSQRSNFLSRITSDDNELLQKMQQLGLSPEQLNEMSRFGVQNMGSTFDVNQVLGARGLEKAGIGGTMAEHMQRQAMLAQAGAQNPQVGLQSVLSAAVTHGIENAKNMTAMAENTAALVSRSNVSAFGMDVSGFAAAELGAGLNTNTKISEEVRTRTAMTNLEAAQSGATNADNSLSGYMNTAGIMRTTGASGERAARLAKISTQDIKAILAEQDPEKRRVAARDLGISVEEAQSLLDEKQMAAIRGRSGNMFLNDPKLMSSFVSAIRSGKNSNQLEKEVGTEKFKDLSLRIREEGFTGSMDEIMGTLRGVRDPNSQIIDPKVKEAMATGKGGDKLTQSMDALRTDGFKQLNEAAISVSKVLKDIATQVTGKQGTVMDYFTGAQQALGKDGVAKESEFTVLAEKMSKDFHAGARLFNDGVQLFNRASIALADAAKVDSSDIKKHLEEMNNSKNNIGSSPGTR